MMIGIVMALADQHVIRLRQPLDQLCGAQPLATAQIDDRPKVCVPAPLRALPFGQWRQRLTSRKQQQQQRQDENAQG